jgi:polysaccharide biosynthesis protein PslH
MSAERSLYVSSYAPALGSGRALRTYTCVRALAMLGPVDLAFVAYDGDGPSAEYAAIEGLDFHRIDSSRGPRRGVLYASKRLQAIPPAACRGTSPELVATAERLARQPERGRVIVGDMSAATALMRLARRRPVIYNAHNIESEWVQGRAVFQPIMRAEMLRYERRLLSIACESWMVSLSDIYAARELVPAARLRYAPNVVDVAAIDPAPRASAPTGEREPRLLMVGDFSYPPNQSGLTFLADSVLPRVWREEPAARLTLVGRGLTEWRVPDSRIELAGYVDDLAPYYGRADCVVVPLTEGAGTPLKFVEAMAYGMPVVATPLAAKGLEVLADVHYREASDARTFADAIVGILRHGAPEMAVRARRLAEREYSIEALAERLAAAAEPASGADAQASGARTHDRSAGRARKHGPGAGGAQAGEPGAGGAPGGSNPVRWLSHATGTALGRRYPFVLCYHGVGAVAESSDPHGIFLSRDLFARHLDVVEERGYEMLAVGELWRLMASGSGAAGKGAITFDDGLRKTAHEAVPMLLDRGMSCSMFLPTGLIGRAHPDLERESIVSASEVRELAARGVEIGAHSVDHVALTGLSYADALDQMRRSRATLEDLLGKPVTTMAYPFGALNQETMRAAAEAGYETACACSGAGPWRAMSIPREPVYATAASFRLRLKMAGLYGPAYALVGDHGPLHRRPNAKRGR